nr:receptor-like protein 7 [Ziziphus jujuba var. spinosa]
MVLEIVVANSLTSVQPACHDDESSALMQFKDSLAVHKSASPCDPKVLQWKSHGVNSSNCCSWDGVQCDGKIGHVIGLDLSSSCLFGSINSNSTLFNLVHLQSLNLAVNNFNYSEIPVSVGQLFRLTYLNLSGSTFSGHIPKESSHLHKLSHLDIQVDISSMVPDFLANFTSLASIILYDCGLHGEFPATIFQLPNLRILDASSNGNLKGYFPEFHHRSSLEELRLGGTKFYGSLPSSIQMLDSLDILDFHDCNFSGPIPSSLGKLTKLTYLYLGKNNFCCHIPSSLRNLTQLSLFNISTNQISGPIPTWLGNLTTLNMLDLSRNQLNGLVPQSLYNLMNLEWLYLHSNNLSGTLKFDNFLSMKSLTYLHLSENNFSILFGKGNKNATSSKFKHLGMKSCNLSEFPEFIRYQNELEWLSLSKNNMEEIPKWMWNTSVDTLFAFGIANNFLKGFLPVVLPWVNLRLFIVSSNMLQGVPPIPPPSIMNYNVSDNLLNGEVSHTFCSMSSLYFLDLSDNNLGGMIPQCLGNLSSTLYLLNLRNNSFHGNIPELCSDHASNLRIIDVSYNKLQGKLPRTLSNCKMLEGIIVSNNQLTDVFPSWLGSLPVLKLLILQHNGFYGEVKEPKNHYEFPKLQVIDISYKNFTSELPSHNILSWNAMMAIDPDPFTYLSVTLNFTVSKTAWYQVVSQYAITITSKGVKRYHGAIQDMFAFIDMSSNRFEGDILKLFGNLRALHSLNLSNNMLTGCIPSSLGNLTALESLDLSQNNLSGEIPQHLKQLGFLESFNVSHNNLGGPIPQGNQFNAFESSSLEGNPGLCGDPLFKKCADFDSMPLPASVFEENDDSESFFNFDWKFVLIGYISGLVVGVVLSDFVIIKRHGWWLFRKNSVLALNQFNADRYSSNHSVSNYNVYDFLKWDGVQCDEEIGHVIGLDLNRGCLFGSINSNSTLFNLVHLQRLNLVGNNFNYSEIPFAIGKLSGLTYLNLSRSSFRGQIPKEISHLFKLSQLDLSFNYNENVKQKVLELKNPNLSSLLQNLTGLEVLDLSYVNISSIVPNFLSNFTSLASLFLLNCGLHGEFPATTFQLPNLRYLDVGSNRNLKGYLLEFKHKSPLKELILHKSGFSGILPSSIQMLDSLDLLNVDGCNFSGFGPSSLGKLAQLTTIHLGHNNFVGCIPSSLQNLTQLTSLYLFSNYMTGPIPPWLRNLTKLNTLLLGHNQFYGLVPQSLSDIINLETLYLCANNLSGTLKFDMFFGMKFLTILTLGENSLSIFIMKGNKNATSSKFKRLELGSCNLNTFLDFLRHQNELEVLVLHNNKIRGEIPEWMWNTSIDTFRPLNIANNLLTGSQPAVLPWVNLQVYIVSFNMLQGVLPIPPPSILSYNASNNMPSGEISPMFCNPSYLYFLDLSDNTLTDIFTFIDISSNRFEGEISELFGNLKGLYSLNLSNNILTGCIPSSLGNLTVLESLDLSQNKLSGQIPQQLKELGFLERFNVSHNNLTGPIPQGK